MTRPDVVLEGGFFLVHRVTDGQDGAIVGLSSLVGSDQTTL